MPAAATRASPASSAWACPYAPQSRIPVRLSADLHCTQALRLRRSRRVLPSEVLAQFLAALRNRAQPRSSRAQTIFFRAFQQAPNPSSTSCSSTCTPGSPQPSRLCRLCNSQRSRSRFLDFASYLECFGSTLFPEEAHLKNRALALVLLTVSLLAVLFTGWHLKQALDVAHELREQMGACRSPPLPIPTPPQGPSRSASLLSAMSSLKSASPLITTSCISPWSASAFSLDSCYYDAAAPPSSRATIPPSRDSRPPAPPQTAGDPRPRAP